MHNPHELSAKEKLKNFWHQITSCTSVAVDEMKEVFHKHDDHPHRQGEHHQQREHHCYEHEEPHHRRSDAGEFCSLASQLKHKMEAKNEAADHILCTLVKLTGHHLGIADQECMGLAHDITELMS